MNTIQKSLTVFAVLALTFTMACGEHDHENNTHVHPDVDENNSDTPSEHEKMACMQFGDAGHALNAGTDVAGAKDVKLMAGKVNTVTLISTGEGFVSLHGLKVHSDLSLFVAESNQLNSFTINGTAQDLPSPAVNSACEDTIKGFYKVHIHEDGMAVFGLKGEADSTVKIIVMGADSDHSDHSDHM